MDKSAMHNWVRQARHRAKKHNVPNNLIADEISHIVDLYDCCPYCKSSPETLDHLFPIKDGAPNIAANVTPICRKCKCIKRNNSIAWMFTNNHISSLVYTSIIEAAASLPGSTTLMEYLKKISGRSE